jgi:ribosome-binding factor A
MNSNRKTLQLCHQVAETLNYVLSGECHDDILQSLQVIGVEPAPNASQLLVTVSPLLAEDKVDPADVLARLNSAAGWLRSEVAGAIRRKRAPQLAFRVLRTTSLMAPEIGSH